MTAVSGYNQSADLRTSRRPVTDHAVVRWLERVKGLAGLIADNLPTDATDAAKSAYGCWLLDMTDLEAREAILPRRLDPLLDLHPVAIRLAGCRLIVSGRMVVTVVGKPVHE